MAHEKLSEQRLRLLRELQELPKKATREEISWVVMDYIFRNLPELVAMVLEDTKESYRK